MTFTLYRWNGTTLQPLLGAGGSYTPPGVGVWDDSNHPAMLSSSLTGSALETYLMQEYPADWVYPTIVDYTPGISGPASGSDFFAHIYNQCQAAGARIVIRLQGGTVYHCSRFVPIPITGGGSILYAMGLWHSNLQGFITSGPGPAIIQMDADSFTGAQITALESMTTSEVLNAAVMRLDGQRRVLAGIQVRAADQQDISDVHQSIKDYGSSDPVCPQPAPHAGVFLFPSTGGSAYLSHLDLVGAGRAVTSAPPFECANIGTQYGDIRVWNCHSDGRRHPDIDPARPRRCGVWMTNNDTWSGKNIWMHHSNLSRWATNDGGQTTVRSYYVENVQIEEITNNQNVDPALNGGASLGGWTNPCVMGYETCVSPIELNGVRLTVDNTSTSLAIQQHLQLAYVASSAFPTAPTSPPNAKLTVIGGIFHNVAFPAIDGFLTVRIAQDIWWRDLSTYLWIWNGAETVRKTGRIYTGAWNNGALAAWVSSNGFTPDTDYIVRQSNT